MKKTHVMYDVYAINNDLISKDKFMYDFLGQTNKTIFNNQCLQTIVPYFNGKVKVMGGVSGMLLGDNMHFTCHTFSYLNCVFIDYFGDEKNGDAVKFLIDDTFKTQDYSYCDDNENKKGNFGKHLIITTNNIKGFIFYQNQIKNILRDIEMTPIHSLLSRQVDEETFDLLQLIAESHISIHANGQIAYIDVFSCKDFDEQKVMNLFPKILDAKIVNRGISFPTEDEIIEKEKVLKKSL